MTEFLYQKFDLFDRSPIESFNPGHGRVEEQEDEGPREHREEEAELAGVDRHALPWPELLDELVHAREMEARVVEVPTTQVRPANESRKRLRVLGLNVEDSTQAPRSIALS